uniref:Uncharacterized protein n=1 Tax=Oryctolagus cuniculus TaxID=9986 RepID=A0A5F9DI12_RABIT
DSYIFKSIFYGGFGYGHSGFSGLSCGCGSRYGHRVYGGYGYGHVHPFSHGSYFSSKFH